jgi:hypothetical protein
MLPRLRRFFGFELQLTQQDRLRRHPRPQARLLVEPLEDRWVPALTYHGGPLIANVQIEALYYSPWNTDSTLQTQKTTLDSFFTFIAKSTYIDLLAQYSTGGTTIGRGSFSGDDSNFPTASTTPINVNGIDYGAIDDTQIQSDLSTEINAGNNKLTAPNANTLYFVFTSPGVVVTSATLGNSVQTFSGYHSSYTDSKSGKDVFYAVLPYPDNNPNPVSFVLNSMQQLEETASHELAEAITDPKVSGGPFGWFDDASSGEVGDLCSFTYATFNGFVVQNLFSNATNTSMNAAGTNFFIRSFENPTEGEFTGVVATFVDTSGLGVLSTAFISWGDGTEDAIPSPVVVRVNSNTFNLIASHTYSFDDGTTLNPEVILTLTDGSQAGDVGEVDVVDSNGVDHFYTDKGLVTLTDPAVIAAPVKITATVGTAFSGAVATFTDPPGSEPNDGSNYIASINWGDNTAATAGTITFSDGAFTVSGNHTYAASGSFTVTCTINHNGVLTTVGSQVTFVATPPPAITPPADQDNAEGLLNSFTLGSFTDPNNGPWTVTVAWGDGTRMTLSPTKAGSLGSQAHTYAEEGSYTVTITITDTGDDRSASATFQAIISDPAVLATNVNLTAVEGTAFSNQAVATFTDPGGAEADDSSHYFATIDWGDGTATVGTITLNNGTFTISGDHTYIEEGSYRISVTIAHEDAPPATVTGSATVSDPAVRAEGLNIIPEEGQPTSVLGGTIWAEAQFTDPGGPEIPGNGADYSATINWGDGTTSTGNIVEEAATGMFSVVGNHTYSEEGSYQTTIMIAHDKAATVTVTGSATVLDPAVLGTSVNISATPGTPFSGSVATFTDPGGAEANDGTHYTASIDWGDKTMPTTGIITVSGSTFTVSGNHIYGAPGTYTIVCTINHEVIITTVKGQATVAATPAPTVTAPVGQNAAEGASSSFSLGSFTDPNNGPWSGTVAWGDGTTNTTLTPVATGSLASQAHTYAEEGTYTVTVTVSDTGDGQSGSATFQTTVSDPAVSGTPVNASATAATPFSGAVATFIDPGGAEANDGTHYTASIDWGDKTMPTTGTITVSGNTLTVSGNHTYGASGSYTAVCTIDHEGVNTAVNSQATVAATPAPTVTAPAGQNAAEGASSSFSLGSFTDPNNGPWSGTVAWGDGTTNTTLTPTTTGSLGSQAHTYAEEGTYTVTVTVSDAGDRQSGSGTFQIVVSDPAVLGTAVNVSAMAGTPFGGAVASFTDPAGAESNDGTHYIASIDWGDKTPATTGTITFNSGTFTVGGNHSYASPDSHSPLWP